MTNLLYPLIIAILLIITNYIAFGYGVRIGKAMQKEIPSPPLSEPAKKLQLKLARGLKGKVFTEKKEPKEELGMFD